MRKGLSSITLHVPLELHQQMKILAIRLRMPMRELIMEAMDEKIDKERKRKESYGTK